MISFVNSAFHLSAAVRRSKNEALPPQPSFRTGSKQPRTTPETPTFFMKSFFAFIFTTVLAFSQTGPGNPTILTGQYSSNRTAANTNEAILTPSNVNAAANQFGRLNSYTVDGQIYAQPLYVPGVAINGKSTNVVYVATMHNSIYAFDAAKPGDPPLWKASVGASVPAGSGQGGCPVASFTGPELGILSTPVIDTSTKTLYAVAANPGGGGYQHFIHALDLTTGQEKVGSPAQIQASVPGSGYNSQGGTVSLTPASSEIQRASLLLANGTVYAAFGNCGPDNDPWHGWVIGYNASNLQNRKFVFNSTPNSGQGGIWQSGRGLLSDSVGDIYFATGNTTGSSITTGSGSQDAARGNYGMRLLQLSSAGQFLTSYPPPDPTYAGLNNNDLDFSSSGPLLIPGTNLLVAGGKDGVVYTFNTTSFGNPLQSFQATGTGTCSYSSDGCNQIHDVAFWNNHLYVWGSHDVLRSFKFNPSTSKFATTPESQNTIAVNYRPATLAVSANGTQNGIVWSTTPDNVLHAFDANNVATELWSSTRNASRDGLPSFVRFAEPTIANGRVFVATASNQLAVYGLLSQFTLSTSPSAQSVVQGVSTTFTTSVTAVGGYSGSVSLSASGLPAGTTASFNPPSITGSGSSIATIATSATTPPGTTNVLISANGSGETKTANFALTVTTPDTTPPTATCCTYTVDGNSYVLHYTGQDGQSGMKSIVPVQLVNATASVPPFTAGTTGVINFTATESGFGSYAKFQLTDVAGNSIYIDPMFFNPSRQAGPPIASDLLQPFAIKGVCKAGACTDDTYGEGTVTIQNGSPGLKNLRIQINDGLNLKHVEVAGLKDGETRAVDITGQLADSGPTTVELIPLGKPGGTAIVIFGPGLVTPAP